MRQPLIRRTATDFDNVFAIYCLPGRNSAIAMRENLLGNPRFSTYRLPSGR